MGEGAIGGEGRQRPVGFWFENSPLLLALPLSRTLSTSGWGFFREWAWGGNGGLVGKAVRRQPCAFTFIFLFYSVVAAVIHSNSLQPGSL